MTNPIRWFMNWLAARQRDEDERRAAHVREFQRNAEISAFFAESDHLTPGARTEAWLEWHDELFGEEMKNA